MGENFNKRALDELDNESSLTEANKMLDNLDNLDKQQSLGKVTRHDYSEETVKEINTKFGWHRLNIEDLPTSGRFYDSTISILIKAATVNEIRYFSTLDESDPRSVDEGLIDLIKTCVRVSFSNKQGQWKDIKEEDKIHVILSIRELTFANNENIISFPVKCTSCGKESKMEIKNENFQKREELELDKYYSSTERSFLVNTKSYGTIKITPPSMGVMRIVSDYIKVLRESKENIKDHLSFIKVLPYMIEDWRGFDPKHINHIKMEFLSWDSKKFLFYNQLVEKVQVGVKDKMSKRCEHCDEIIEADVQLPTGIKGLFIEDSVLDNELI